MRPIFLLLLFPAVFSICAMAVVSLSFNENEPIRIILKLVMILTTNRCYDPLYGAVIIYNKYNINNLFMFTGIRFLELGNT